jgi:hypothetical protein
LLVKAGIKIEGFLLSTLTSGTRVLKMEILYYLDIDEGAIIVSEISERPKKV